MRKVEGKEGVKKTAEKVRDREAGCTCGRGKFTGNRGDGGAAPGDANYSHPSSLAPPLKHVSGGLGADHTEYTGR